MSVNMSSLEVEGFEDMEIFAEELNCNMNPSANSASFSTFGTLTSWWCALCMACACTAES
jgi:hypothetical protein